jgi:hypothetical protein
MDVVPAAVTSSPGLASAAALALVLAAIPVMAACSAPAEPTRSAAAPLTNTFDAPEALAQAVLAALSSADLERLRSLPLSEAEFRDHVWPELPTSRPERNVPFDYAWGQMKQRSDGHLQQTFARYARRPLKFVRTRFTGETTTYATFSVMRESEIVATDDTGRDLVLRLYGSAMVKDGRYKLFSYVVDE